MRMTLILAVALAGCTAPADRLSPVGYADAKWMVIAINDRPTPRTGYFVNLVDRKISARFGCNSISGWWHLNGDHLSTRDLMQTEMGCPEPAASFEQLGSAVLNSNMRIERISGDQIRLISEAGSIELRRAR